MPVAKARIDARQQSESRPYRLITPISLGSMAMGDTAIVGSESTIKTVAQGKPVSLRSREMLHAEASGRRLENRDHPVVIHAFTAKNAMKHLFARSLRALVLGIAILPTVMLAATAATSAIEVYHDPACGCCVNWLLYMQAQGYVVTAREDQSMAVVKARLGVPANAASCHTARIGGYVIEGHVPSKDLRRPLAERPDARGLVAPGMPMGSPGMEMGATERYDVLLIARDGSSRVFATHGPKI